MGKTARQSLLSYTLRMAFTSAALLALNVTCSPEPEPSFRELVLDQHRRHPLMQLSDLYKFIHQGAFGSEHAVTDTAVARHWLRSELNGLSGGPDNPWLDPLTPDSALVRVHLRPYVARGGDTELLLRAFVATANTYSGSQELMEERWAVARQMAAEGLLPFPTDVMNTYIHEMAPAGYPAVHHSDGYREAYRPAYRVVALRVFRELVSADPEP